MSTYIHVIFIWLSTYFHLFWYIFSICLSYVLFILISGFYQLVYLYIYFLFCLLSNFLIHLNFTSYIFICFPVCYYRYSYVFYIYFLTCSLYNYLCTFIMLNKSSTEQEEIYYTFLEQKKRRNSVYTSRQMALKQSRLLSHWTENCQGRYKFSLLKCTQSKLKSKTSSKWIR